MQNSIVELFSRIGADVESFQRGIAQVDAALARSILGIALRATEAARRFEERAKGNSSELLESDEIANFLYAYKRHTRNRYEVRPMTTQRQG